MIRPLLVTVPLIKPIQTGRKTETRRTRDLDMINEHPDDWVFVEFSEGAATFKQKNEPTNFWEVKSPYGSPGDELWIRENWFVGKGYDDWTPRFLPKPSGPITQKIEHGFEADGPKPEWAGKTRPNIFMPRWMSRITVEITDLTVERAHQITEAGAKREGVQPGIFRLGPNVQKGEYQLELNNHASYIDGFRFTWAEINGLASWDLNPWVWVISFKLKTP